ncbi:hypothetical protein JVT61DRAFT_10376 [Boletus reticuloceps]|uniref:Uncharacterized protein n=1 Tax=Boletus reticuloceps TaxID=495285 RepID=A0A8I2YZE9_9AGAM|nr:hypothetical protein JVT61DRAFT_10376 [Boletus reticuloceps]
MQGLLAASRLQADEPGFDDVDPADATLPSGHIEPQARAVGVHGDFDGETCSWRGRARHNTQKQAQAAKCASLIATTRIFNGMDGASRIIVVILLCEDVRTVDAVHALATSVTEDVDAIEGSIEDKTSLQFIPVHYHRYWEALDATKAANYAPFLLSPNVEVPEAGNTLFRMLQAQGLPAAVSAIPPDPSTSSFNQKSPTAILKSLFSFM